MAWRGHCLEQARAMCSTLVPTGLFQLAGAIHQTHHWDAALHLVGADGGPAVGNLSFLAQAHDLGLAAQAALFALGSEHALLPTGKKAQTGFCNTSWRVRVQHPL